MSDRPPLVDPSVLARVAHLSVRVKGLVEGGLTGQHRSPHHGSSVEFAQHREYAPGDEIRHIDWKAFGKSDRYHVKQYEDETNLRAYLLVDRSGSMDYNGGAGPTKADYAAQLAATLGWLMLKQGDAVGALPFGERVHSYVPPRTRSDHYWHLSEALRDSPIGGTTQVVGALSHVAELVQRRSVIMLFSDCFEFDPRLVGLCRQLRRRHAVFVFHVLHPDEIAFPFKELTVFEDLETDVRELADPRGMRAQYLEEMTAFCDGLRRGLRDGDVAYHLMPTHRPLERALGAFLGGPA